MKWQFLPTLSAPMPLQMALDEALFESQKKEPREPILRFYVSAGPWISAGCSFRDPGSLLRSKLVLENPGVPVCRRITGGGCVLHGGDLIFSLTAPLQFPELVSNSGNWKGLGSVRTSYAKIHEGVRIGLQACGVDPKFYGAEDKLPKGNDCFDFPVESDLSWKGKKIAGGAQKRSGGVLLHHESIAIPNGVDRCELEKAVRQGMEEALGVEMVSADLDPEIYFQAERLIKTTDWRPETTD